MSRFDFDSLVAKQQPLRSNGSPSKPLGTCYNILLRVRLYNIVRLYDIGLSGVTVFCVNFQPYSVKWVTNLQVSPNPADITSYWHPISIFIDWVFRNFLDVRTIILSLIFIINVSNFESFNVLCVYSEPLFETRERTELDSYCEKKNRVTPAAFWNNQLLSGLSRSTVVLLIRPELVR